MPIYRNPLYDKFWREAEPIAVHAFIVVLLETTLLLIGLLTRLLTLALPKQENHLALIEMIDCWIALALISMFGAYTLVQVGIRLARALENEWTRKNESATEVEP